MASRCILGALLGAVAVVLLRLIGVWGSGGIMNTLMGAVLIGAPLGALWGALEWNPGVIWGTALGAILGAVWCSAGPTVGALVSGGVGAIVGAYLVEKHEDSQRVLLRPEKKDANNQEETKEDSHD